MRIALHAFFLILFTALQSTWLNGIEILNVTPNLTLIYIIVVSCFCGRAEGASIGFVFGLMLDLMTGKIWGIYAILGMIMGFSVSNFCERLYGQKNIIFTLVLVLIGSLLFELVYYLICFFSVENISLKYALLWVVLPEGVFNTVVAVPLYLVVRKIAKFIYNDKGE